MEKLGVDLDEILTDFNRSLLSYYNDKYHKSFLESEMKTYFLSDIAGLSRKEEYRIINEYFNSETFRGLLPSANSVEGINNLGEKFELYLITSRPNAVKKSTILWIEDHFPDIFKFIIFSKNKTKICKNLGIEYIVEDNPKIAEDCARHGIQVFLFSKPWNIKLSPCAGVTRVNNFKEIIKITAPWLNHSTSQR